MQSRLLALLTRIICKIVLRSSYGMEDSVGEPDDAANPCSRKKALPVSLFWREWNQVHRKIVESSASMSEEIHLPK